MKCPKCLSDNTETAKFCSECGLQLDSADGLPVSFTETLVTPVKELIRGSKFAGRYEIIEELGQGGLGKVYRVEDTKIHEEIALKLIKTEIATDKKTIERFSNELKLARKIAHRNVCRMFDLGEDEGIHFITLEYVPGEDLKSFIRRARRLDTSTAIAIAKQVCEGLTEAHRLGVVHRDLKPSNVMIDKEGNAHIMDFGIARSLKAKGVTEAGVMIGTPEYMSPEQVEAKEVDFRSDIYSLGVMLYEMTTGQLPFEGDTPLSVAIKHREEKPKNPRDLNPQIPEDLGLLILKCLEKDRKNRNQKTEELLSELSRIEKGNLVTERVISGKKPLVSREKTEAPVLKKLLFPASVTIAAAIIGVIIWQTLFRKEAPPIPSDLPSIAVISFENQTGDDAYNYLQKAIPNLLITSLEGSGHFRVTTWERMYDLLEQMGRKDVGLIDRDLGFELCRMEGIDAIVLGSFIKAGDIFATDVKVLELETKRLLKSASAKGEGVGSILKTQINELRKDISRGIGISEAKIEAAQLGIEDYTTTSMDAYHYYLRGADEVQKLYFGNAIKFLEKAIELYPAFAAAHSFLGFAFLLQQNTNAANAAYEKAKKFSAKATDKERLYIEADYAWYIEADEGKRFRILKQITKKFPKEKQAHYWLGYYYSQRKLFPEAIEEYNKTLKLDPSYGIAIMLLGYVYVDIRDFEKALEYFTRYASVSPGDANPFDCMGKVYLLMGMLDEAIEKYKQALEIKPDFGSDLKIAYIYALEENYPEAIKWVDRFISIHTSQSQKAHGYLWKGFYLYWLGRLDHSLGELQRAAELAEAGGNVAGIGYADWMKGWIYYEKGEFKQSRKYLKSSYDLHRETFLQNTRVKAIYHFSLGLVDLKEQRIESAKPMLDEITSLLPEADPIEKAQMKLFHDLLQGEIWLVEDYPKKAIALCEKAPIIKLEGLGPLTFLVNYNIPFYRDVLARAYNKNRELDKAISEYERLITFSPSIQDRRLIHPVFFYRIARLYEQKGEKDKALGFYEKFSTSGKTPTRIEQRSRKQRKDCQSCRKSNKTEAIRSQIPAFPMI
ncbi:protein kinase [Acidobacteriota bacterium]